MTDIQELIRNIRAWQSAAEEYEAACAEAEMVCDPIFYTSTPRKREAIKALDEIAMSLIHDAHNDDVLNMLITLADEVEQTHKRVRSLRITIWEIERDAKYALDFLGKADYEHAASMVNLTVNSIKDALEIDRTRE